MAGPSLDDIFRDVIAAKALPHHPHYENACRINTLTICMVNILLMRHRGISTEGYIKDIRENNPDTYKHVGPYARWELLEAYLREYMTEHNVLKEKDVHRLSKSM